MILYDLLISVFILIVSYFSISFLNLIYRNFYLTNFYSQRKNIKKFGNWVIITGGTDGIGKGFAELLAKDGYNLIIISRSEEKLNELKTELSKFNIEIKLIKSDFTKIDIYENIEAEIKGLSIGMLINNVGMSYYFPNSLSDDLVTNEFIYNLITCNCLSTSLMTKLVLNNGMLEKGGFIMNISSGFGKVPSPFLSIYGASKAYINQFSVNLASEVKYSKVFIQNVEPLVVSTKMSRVNVSLFTPSARYFADSVLNRLGTCSSTHGCFVHEFQGWIIKMIPEFIIEKITHSSILSRKARALRKMNKQQ